MDWGNDYFTFSDTNIEYIWRFLKTVHERGWLYVGHRSTEWCPRCGTSISQHELRSRQSTVDRADPSLYVRFPLLDRHGRVDRDLDDDAVDAARERRRGRQPERGVRPSRRTASGSPSPRYPDEQFAERARARSWSAGATRGRSTTWRRARPSSTASSRGTRCRWRRAPGSSTSRRAAVARTSSSPACTTCPCSRRSTRPAGSTTTTAGCTALSTVEAAEQIIGRLEESGRLVEAGLYEHRYPECWRCHTPLIFRIADDWFISVDELRPKLLEANATVEWVPEYMGKRMDDWLRNMGDWNISRRRYYGLPLPIYPCSCGHLNVIGSKAELAERALEGIDQLEELRRPWIDRVPIRCEACGEPVTRIPEVGDVWLDAGIVPFSTLGWQNPEWIDEGYATGAAQGSDEGRPARPRLLGEVVPCRLGDRDARADPPLVLLAALHVGRR